MTLEERFLKEYDLHADAVFRYCSLKLSDREEAKDVVQETFAKCWNYIANGGEIKNVKAFLFRVARNLVYDRYRKKKTESLDVLTENGFDPKFEEESSLEEKLDARDAMGLLDLLPVDYKEVLMLRYMEEMSIKEISEALEQAPGNISVKIHRALAKLRSIYKEKEQKNV